ncbi:TRAP transporter substrate-binding protein [Marivibrio halodurans]|uniref:TRAP transporter substrate-binding protein n=1 Tax=Marivibrio halodurans TaxID=2039722 RepID=A0A8J7RVK4_9PROT|nr:TRAP transporter substrate-binding protein [Marivibrio halodurans]MBP5855497.1 TRAP transporter substrate-binding protein [Marivibrio halodurans]
MSKSTKKSESGVSRRKFLRGGAVAAAAAPAAMLSAPHIAKAATTLKVQAAWGGGIFLEFAQDYVDRVNKMAGGAMKIDLLGVGAVVKTAEMQTAVHNGVLDGAHLVTAYWYSKSPVASLFGTGPCFGWTANEMMGWVQYGGGRELYNELMHDMLGLDLVGFFSGPMPAQPLGWFKEQITDAAQMQGLKYRTVGLAADVLQEMGMSVVQLPGGEIQPAMKSGLIDAAEFNNPTADRDFGMQDVSKHYHLGSFHQSQESFEIIFNKTLFDNLSEEQRAILEYASEAASTDMAWKAMERYSQDLVALREEFGVNVYRTPDAVMKQQLEAWDVVVDRISSEDPFFAKVVESQKNWAQRHGAYALQNAPDYRAAYEHYFGAL